MKTLSLVFCIFMGIAVSVFGRNECESTGWKVVLETKVNHGTTLCAFENPDFGITVGPHGETHYTLDKGESWPLGRTTVQCRFGLDILDSNRSVSAGNGGVCISKDGGKYFSTIMKDRYDLVSFASAEQGWIGNRRLVKETANGGASWKDIPVPEKLKMILGMNMFGSGSGYILDKDGTLFFTDDGGSTWSSKIVKSENGDISLVHSLSVMRWKDQAKGSVITWYRKGEKKGWILLITENGGKTWSSEVLNVGAYGTPYLSRDSKYLTIFDISSKRITLIART
jgi:hypothetical protein